MKRYSMRGFRRLLLRSGYSDVEVYLVGTGFYGINALSPEGIKVWCRIPYLSVDLFNESINE